MLVKYTVAMMHSVKDRSP